MGVAELLDTAFRLYRQNFFLFVGIVAVVYVPLTLIQTVNQLSFSPFGPISPLVQLLTIFVSFFAIQGLMNGAMARAVSDCYLGRQLGLVDTFRALGWRWLRLAGGIILITLLNIGIGILSFIPCLGTIAALILWTYINVPVLALLAPVIVIENQGAVASVRRAFNLGRRRFWRLFGLCLLLAAMLLIIFVALFILLFFGYELLQPDFDLAIILYQLVWSTVIMLIIPVGLVPLTLFYFDLRIRLEGFDLELMVEHVHAEVVPAIAPGQISPDLLAQQHLDQAYAFEGKDEFENALRQCESAIQLVAGWAEAHNLRGVLLESLGQPEQALKAYRRAVHLAPAFSEASENLREAEAEFKGKD